jgi:ribosomal protein S18 acetylase RimI-like enzyme
VARVVDVVASVIGHGGKHIFALVTSHRGLRFRCAGCADAAAIAALHADSWRNHYRGAFSDSFLDGDLEDDRYRVWSQRLEEAGPATHTVLAEDDDGLVGFAHTIFDADPSWGALLDNLHVARRHQRRGIGSRLLVLTAQAVVERRTGLYLWVLEQNQEAQSFYEAHRGWLVERAPNEAPGGIPGRLNGTPMKLRCVWSPSALRALCSAGAIR